MSSKKNHVVFLLFLAAILTVPFQNCSQVKFAGKESTGSSLDVGQGRRIIRDIVVGDPQTADEWSYSQSTAPIDILFVVDNSPSMVSELAKVAQAFAGFTDKIKNSQWQICMINTYVNINNEGGEPLSFNAGGLKVLTKDVPNHAQVFADALRNVRLQTEINDPDGMASTEQGISAIRQFLSAHASPCFRTDSTKAVIILSDEDELNNGDFPDSYAHRFNQPSGVVSAIKAAYGNERTFVVHSVIVEPEHNQCLAAQRAQANAGEFGSYEGTRYAELSFLTGGDTYDVCREDYANSLAELAQDILSSATSIQLQCTNPDIVSITVDSSINPTPPWGLLDSRVKFNPSLKDGDIVHLDYFCHEGL